MSINNDDILREWPEIGAHLNDMDAEMSDSFEKETGFNIDNYEGERYGDIDRESWVPHTIIDNTQELAETDGLDNIIVGKTPLMDVVFGNSRLLMRKVGGEQITNMADSIGALGVEKYAYEDGEEDHSLIVREETLPSDNLRPSTTAERYDIDVMVPEGYVESLKDLENKLDDEYTVEQAYKLADALENKEVIADIPAEDYGLLEVAEELEGDTGALIYSGSAQDDWQKGDYDSVIPLTPKMADEHIKYVNNK